MYTIGIIIIFSVQFFCNLAQEIKCSGHICIPPNYEKVNPPFPNEILNVSVNFQDIWIQKVDDVEHTVSLSLDIWLTWEEPRLKINSTMQEKMFYAIDKSFLNLLWIPDIFIYDAKKLVKNGVVGDLESLSYRQRPFNDLPSSKLHFLTYCVTLNVEIVCHEVNFDDYPFDSHECFFEMASYTYTKAKLIFNVLIEGNFIYYKQKGFLCSDFLMDLEKFPIERNVSEFDHSITGFQINMQRNIEKYIFNYYIPSGLMVITSWISFVIPPEVVPGRMGLLITLFLVLVNLFISITTNTPNTKSLTSISTWVLACITFVQGAVLEYGCILLFKYFSISDFGINVLRRVDIFSLILSVLTFSLFNFIYWMYVIPKWASYN